MDRNQQPASLQALSDFAGELTRHTVGHGQRLNEQGERLGKLEERVDAIREDRTRCSGDHNRQIEELGKTVSELSKTVREHITEDRVHRASLDGWSKLLLGLSPLATALAAAWAAAYFAGH